jgi:hypothetical protein
MVQPYSCTTRAIRSSRISLRQPAEEQLHCVALAKSPLPSLTPRPSHGFRPDTVRRPGLPEGSAGPVETAGAERGWYYGNEGERTT